MGDTNVKKTLWENVKALMILKYGEENLNQLARDAGIGPGSASRIKEAKTSVGIDIVERIAKVFKVPTYLLLCPLGDKKQLLTILKAYSETDERGREFLSGASESLLRKRDEHKTGTAD